MRDKVLEWYWRKEKERIKDEVRRLAVSDGVYWSADVIVEYVLNSPFTVEEIVQYLDNEFFQLQDYLMEFEY